MFWPCLAFPRLFKHFPRLVSSLFDLLLAVLAAARLRLLPAKERAGMGSSPRRRPGPTPRVVALVTLRDVAVFEAVLAVLVVSETVLATVGFVLAVVEAVIIVVEAALAVVEAVLAIIEAMLGPNPQNAYATKVCQETI